MFKKLIVASSVLALGLLTAPANASNENAGGLFGAVGRIFDGLFTAPDATTTTVEPSGTTNDDIAEDASDDGSNDDSGDEDSESGSSDGSSSDSDSASNDSGSSD